jgi:hypothetical protein
MLDLESRLDESKAEATQNPSDLQGLQPPEFVQRIIHVQLHPSKCKNTGKLHTRRERFTLFNVFKYTFVN